MRKLGLLFCGGMLAMSMTSTASAEDAAAKVYYKDGTRLEFDDASIKFNVILQPRYEYTDLDSENRVSNGGSSVDDTSSNTMRRGRFVITGKVLDERFSFRVENEIASSSGRGDMLDAWIQWNGDDANVRFGQMRVPFTRQARVAPTHLFFTERSDANEVFEQGREQGAWIHTGSDQFNAYLGLYNGDSTGEGQNSPGVDNKHNAYFAADFSTDNFGRRGVEGDTREDGEFGATVGASVYYGEGTNALGDFDQLGLNVDAAVRCSGFELGGEFYYAEVDVDGSTAEPDANGFQVQGTYNMDDLGFGLRYGLTSPDSGGVGDLAGIDSRSEYTGVINYFINGHHLKLQNNVTFLVTEYDASTAEDVTDLRYTLQLSGYF